MYKIGLSTTRGKVIDEVLFRDYKKAGIDAMEISVDQDAYAGLDYQAICHLAKEYEMELWSYHLPYGPFTEIDISNRELKQHTIAYLSELIKKGTDIGIDKFIIHASGEPIEEEKRGERMECAKESLAELADIAAKCGAVIAVEDLPRTCLGRDSADIAELLSAHDALRVCFDTNHLLTEDPIDFIYKLGDRIITTHVSDCDFINERHWLPGEGKINWQALLQALKDVDYQGAWLYEIGFACPKTIIRDRDLTCEDFVRNARELFAGEVPTVFSRHKEKLGMWE